MSDHVKKKQEKIDEMDKNIIDLEKKEAALIVNLSILSNQCQDREKQLEDLATKEKEIEDCKEKLKNLKN